MFFSTCDLCDANAERLAGGSLSVLPPLFIGMGKRRAFAGQAFTLKVFEDNALVRAALETPGQGRVLVVDGGGSVRSALVGGNLASLAADNGWHGIVVFGAVRDLDEIEDCEVGVRALALHPQRSARKSVGDSNVKVMIAGVAVEPGDWIYADADGILVSKDDLG